MEQFSIFDELFDPFKIEKPIRLIELFAGYGSQALALKYLGVKFEHHKICEWAVNSIIAYADLHRNELLTYGIDYTKEMSKEEIARALFDKGVSIDYNKPATFEQLKRVNEDRLRLCFNSIIWTHNLVDVSKTKGIDLHIEYPKTFTYLLTYSFPCQDLSLAGKRAGMSKGTGTRSGLLFEVERILKELYENNQTLPHILLMENVTQVHGEGNLQDFILWQNFLESIGYSNYWQDLIATDYGIPQTRNRTFMISILGQYNYKFPKPIELKLRLKDLLENNVSEKYYLSDKMIQYISATGTQNFRNSNSEINCKIARPLTTEQNKRAGTTNYISDDLPDNYDLNDSKNINDTYIAIKNATERGFLEAEEGDGIDISSRMEYHRGTVQKDKSQTITTMGGENVGVVTNNLRIRKLTPRECFRLMGVKDEDIDKIIEHQTNASLYHLAGDSIVVNVLMAIFKQLF